MKSIHRFHIVSLPEAAEASSVIGVAGREIDGRGFSSSYALLGKSGHPSHPPHMQGCRCLDPGDRIGERSYDCDDGRGGGGGAGGSSLRDW